MTAPTGTLVGDTDRQGRYLRVSGHGEHGRTVLSLWQGDACIGTLRLDAAGVDELLRVLPTTRDESAGQLPQTGATRWADARA